MRIAFIGIDEVRNLRRAFNGDVTGVFFDRYGSGNIKITKAMASIFQNGCA
jgi:hypothetical protein